jgi:hypothetical protein
VVCFVYCFEFIIFINLLDATTTTSSTNQKPIPTEADMLLAVEPYAQIPYEEQLQMKQAESMQIAERMAKEMRACGIQLDDLKTIVKPIQRSPVVDGWRCVYFNFIQNYSRI